MPGPTTCYSTGITLTIENYRTLLLTSIIFLFVNPALTRHTYLNTNSQALISSFISVFYLVCRILLCACVVRTWYEVRNFAWHWFASWISGRIESLQPDTDIQKLLSNGNRIRMQISETLSSIFRGFWLLEKIAHCTIIDSLSSEESFQPCVPWLRAGLWCNLCTVI